MKCLTATNLPTFPNNLQITGKGQNYENQNVESQKEHPKCSQQIRLSMIWFYLWHQIRSEHRKSTFDVLFNVLIFDLRCSYYLSFLSHPWSRDCSILVSWSLKSLNSWRPWNKKSLEQNIYPHLRRTRSTLGYGPGHKSL